MSDHASWAKAQRVGNPVAKAVLVQLATWADMDGEAWVKVPVLAFELECSERKVQRGLAFLLSLEASGGPVERTGRKHLHEGKLVPIYRLRIDQGPADTRIALKACRDLGVTPVSPQAASSGDTRVTPRGDTSDGLGVTPVSPDNLNTESKIKTNTQDAGGREKAIVFEQVLGAWISASRNSRTDPDAAFERWGELIEGGQDAEALGAAVHLALAEDPDFKRRGPPGLQRWLGEKKHVNWLGRAPKDGATPRMRFADETVRSSVVGAKGEAWVGSWLDPSGWDAGRREISPRTRIAVETLRREARGVLGKLGVTVVDLVKA